MLEEFYIIFIVLQKIIAIKYAILHLKEIMLFLLRWKRKIRPKNLMRRKCSVVIVMSVFYPLETLGNGAKKQTAVGLYPTYGRYLPHFVGVKNGQGF